MPTRWVVRTDRGEVSSWYASEADARTRDGKGRLVPGPDGRGEWTYELPDGWSVERVELPGLGDELILAIASLAVSSDGGCLLHGRDAPDAPDDLARRRLGTAIRGVSRTYEIQAEFDRQHPLTADADPDRWLRDPPPRNHGA